MEARSARRMLQVLRHSLERQLFHGQPAVVPGPHLACTAVAPGPHLVCTAACIRGAWHQPRYLSTRHTLQPQQGCPRSTGVPVVLGLGPLHQAETAVKLWPPVTLCLVRGMAGHSKWANIRHIKAAKDTEKARNISEFTRRLRAFIRETGQTDPKTSSQLAKLISEAKSKNIPNANIEKVLTQMSELKSLTPTVYEAKGPSGSVMLIEALTAKKTQTRLEIQGIVKKCGFSLFEGGLAQLAFEEKGVVTVNNPGEATPDLDSYVDIAIEAGAEEVTLEDNEEGASVLQFVCEPNDVYAVKKELLARELPVTSAEVVFNAISTVPMDFSSLEVIGRVLDKLEEHPDVLKVYMNVVEAS